MKVAITADCHLTSRRLHADRYEALENIIEQLGRSQIETLIIAGDLFDTSSQNYAEFDSLCRSEDGRTMRFLVLPGNHDAHLRQQSFSSENVEIITEPILRRFGSHGLKVFLLPYRSEKTMGEFIASSSSALIPNEWVLVSHGDVTEGFPEPNPTEPGIYMPLTRSDIENYKPVRVLLGHIHKPSDKPPVHYVGSPCGLDIRETGKRRFLILDTESGEITAKSVDTKFIYFNESLVILPVKNEAAYLEKKIAEMIESWDVSKEERSKVRLQLRVRGYSSDKRELLRTIKSSLGEFKFYKGWEPDLSEVALAEDFNRAEISQQVVSRLQTMAWQPKQDLPTADDILLHALEVIYGE